MTQHIAGLRQELKDLVAATVRQDPPLSPYMKAKVAKLQRQIKVLEGKLANDVVGYPQGWPGNFSDTQLLASLRAH
jgi:hypothetical protein